jgi:hypothetical protein
MDINDTNKHQKENQSITAVIGIDNSQIPLVLYIDIPDSTTVKPADSNAVNSKFGLFSNNVPNKRIKTVPIIGIGIIFIFFKSESLPLYIANIKAIAKRINSPKIIGQI